MPPGCFLFLTARGVWNRSSCALVIQRARYLRAVFDFALRHLEDSSDVLGFYSWTSGRKKHFFSSAMTGRADDRSNLKRRGVYHTQPGSIFEYSNHLCFFCSLMRQKVIQRKKSSSFRSLYLLSSEHAHVHAQQGLKLCFPQCSASSLLSAGRLENYNERKTDENRVLSCSHRKLLHHILTLAATIDGNNCSASATVFSYLWIRHHPTARAIKCRCVQ